MSAWQIGSEAASPSYSTQEEVRRQHREAGPRNHQPDTGWQQFKSVFDRLTKWIPGDTLALYVPGVTYLATDGGGPSLAFLVVMALVTPLFVVLAAFATGGAVTRRIWISAGLGMVAFAIWSMSVPLSGWQRWHLVASNEAGFAIGAAIAGILFGYFAEGIVRRLPADPAMH